MSHPSNDRDELFILLAAVRDEHISAEQITRLKRLLSENADARQFYVDFMTLRASLEQFGSTEAMAEQVRETLQDEEVVRELQSMIAAERRFPFASTSRRSNMGRYLAAVLTAAALILVALFLGHLILRRQSDAACSAEIAVLYGRVELSGVDGDAQTTAGTVVQPGQSLRTGSNAYVRLRYPDGSMVDLKAATELALVNGTRAKRLKLVTGSAYFDVSPQPSGAPLIVNPGRYDQVEVMGTSFEIRRNKKGETQVFVANGAVRFGADDKAVRIKAKQGSVAVRQKEPSQPKAFDQATLWQGLSRGLSATYYDREDLTGKSVTRVDPSIDFDWGKSSPDPAVPLDKFSARWTGRIQAEHTEPYTFYVVADEGARLWFDGKLVVDGWKNARGEKLASPPTKLIAGRTYDLKLEYHEVKGTANIHLLWSSPSTPRAIVSQSSLHPHR